MTINERIQALRKQMIHEQIDTYIITKFDPHQSEMAHEHFNGVKFISGFTGSRGTVVITLDTANLWVDGRYFIQAERELHGTEFILQKENEPNVLNWMTFCRVHTKKSGVIGFDGAALSAAQGRDLSAIVHPKGITLKTSLDLLDTLWQGRPVLPKTPIFLHEHRYSGVSAAEKISQVQSQMHYDNIDAYLISSLDDVAWLFNLRGTDVPFNTTFLSYALIDQKGATLFVDLEKAMDVIPTLTQAHIQVADYKDLPKTLAAYPESTIFAVNPDTVSYAIFEQLRPFTQMLLPIDITTDLKSMKNPVEISNLKDTYIRDSVNLLKFLKWLKESVGKKPIYEHEFHQLLIDYRQKDPDFYFPSFDTIAAYQANGAITHYHPDDKKPVQIQPLGFLLIDSGGQYLGGTTDITRTIAVGALTEQMIQDFTLVLKSNINLARATFLYGTTGSNIDILARQPMWNNYMDYKHGTGHGIGYFMNVHEGPQVISQKPNKAILKPGMVISNEPGIYRENEYGIRTETTILVKEAKTTPFGQFLCFETISPFPIDLAAIDPSMLTAEERQWINDYHQDVYEKLSPHLMEDERIFLRNETKAI